MKSFIEFIHFYILKGKLHLPPLDFCGFCRHPPMLKNYHLGISILRNANFIPNSKTIPFLKWHRFSFRVRDKIGIVLGFFIRNEQSKRKPILIHVSVSEKFWTLRSIYKSSQSSGRVSKVSPILKHKNISERLLTTCLFSLSNDINLLRVFLESF